MSETFIENTDPLNSPLTVRPNTNFEPTLNDNNGGSPYSVGSGSLIQLNSITDPNEFCSVLPPPAIMVADVPNNIMNAKLLNKLINTEFNYADPAVNAELKFNNDDNVYRYVINNLEFMDESIIIKEFMLQNKSSNIGKFVELETLIADTKLAEAQGMLRGINPELKSEINYLNFYTYFIKYINQELSLEDSIHIDSLAYQCPEIGGASVYKFENLRSMIYDSYNSTVYHCSFDGRKRQMQQTNAPLEMPSNKELAANKLSVVPNPNNGNFSVLATNLNNSLVDFELYTSDSKKLIDDKLQFVDGKANVNLNLPAGFYILKVIDNKQTSTFKIVVNR
jgi:hypothetical protein